MSTDLKIAILLSGCERYRKILDFTKNEIVSLWHNHPPIYSCGFKGADIEPGFNLKNIPSEWGKIHLEAVQYLREHGYDKIYLIIDDHPPLGECNSEILNQEIPRWMDELDSTYIGLLGFGQNQGSWGNLEKKYPLEKMDESQLFKFQLHPALWKLEKLELILKGFIENYSEKDQNIWKFERVGNDDWVEKKSRAGAYRIAGQDLALDPNLSLRELQFRGFIQKRVRKWIRDERQADLLWQWGFWGFISHYYVGPYPLMWAGIMNGGRPHLNVFRFYLSRGQFVKSFVAKRIAEAIIRK